jgi:hypothetical protein
MRGPPLTADELRHAFVSLSRPHWPALEAALYHPWYGRLITGYAWHIRYRDAQHDPRALAAGETPNQSAPHT